MSLKTTYSAVQIQEFMVSNLAEVLETTPEEIDVNEHLENYGLDSAQAMVIISKLENLLGFKPSPVLLWHYPTIAKLAQRLSEENPGKSSTEESKIVAPFLDLGAEVVLDANIIPMGNNKIDVTNPKNIFLTGGTGYLGAFIIKELLAETQANIYCLVRANNVTEAKSKLEKNLQQYAIWDDKYSQRIIPVVGDLAQPLLGISESEFTELSTNIDTIYHSAALLNYVYPYSALKTANVLGTQEVIRLACQNKIKPLHYVSSVAVFESNAYAGKVVKEQDSFDDWQGIFLGYSQTKWVAEKLVKIAGERGLPITIYRPPLIAGDSKTGICNTHDFINLMIKGCLQMGSFP
ncbi:MAG: NAD-dependent epimerase/dehydratase family protein, partial [Nostocales cyanobacterium]